ncbi:phage baseplate assembly protein V [Chitinophaga filiformis]|uniref:phage baseplate assembly protein V n=1 Tax=Chitinophaga filiformis TaxID=104663 RepID=UPI001F364AB3|nr:phage baseplate assembly protein V [Chitinophaga filiformis]MCF6407762.1 phage baseplate assembly protein V [Chitinophaga filiformis]
MESQLLEQLLEWSRSRHFGKYRGIVVDNTDPTNRGRLKVQVPSVLKDLSVWAMPCLPYAGKNVGVFMVPEPGAGVWVEFEAGDLSYPIWTGGFWADDEVPKNEKGAEATPSLRIIRSEKGLLISFNDDAQVLTLSDEDGSNIMTIEVQEGKIKIKGNLKVVVEAPQIELVENATHPVVFGDELMTYLNQIVQIYQSHTHPGELALGVLPVTPAPPLPPLPPPTPSLLSLKVKAG